MKTLTKNFLLFFIVALNFKSYSQNNNDFKPKVVYKSSELIITQISKNTFVHTSYKQTQDFGNVPCNGLIVKDNDETIVFDTPTNDKSSEKLIQWLTVKNHLKINAIIPTHFHDDCLGGLNAFHKHHIPSYAFLKTIELAQQNNLPIPQNGFVDSTILKVGSESVIIKFFGEGHTRDNVVGYFPKENVLFGGCLIKELNASKGYLGDANTKTWSDTVEKVKGEFAKVMIVVPGHGKYGNSKLLDYTINLFKN